MICHVKPVTKDRNVPTAAGEPLATRVRDQLNLTFVDIAILRDSINPLPGNRTLPVSIDKLLDEMEEKMFDVLDLT